MDSDVEAVVKQFDSVLKELTFNSRPIITTLTKMAEENISCAKYFVESLENRIDKCVPTQKLFSFYALDSICKNAGSPYTIFFSKNLFKLYKKTYLIVDNQVRTKLINLFKSWLQPTTSTGEPVFDKSTLSVIESFLMKASALHQKNFENKLPTPTVPLLLKEIDKLAQLTNDRVKNFTQSNNPDDYNKLLTKLEVLKQLRSVLAKEKLSTNALKQVQLQLKQVFAQDQHYLQEKFRQQQQQQMQQQQREEREQQQQLQQKQYEDSNNINSNSPSKSGSPKIPLFNNNNSESNPQSSSATPMAFSTLFGTTSSVTPVPTPSLSLNQSSSGLVTQDIVEIGKQNKLNKIQSLYDSLNKEKLLFIPNKNSIITLFDKLSSKNNTESNGNIEESSHELPSIPTLLNILNDFNAIMTVNNINLNNAPNLQLNQQNITSNDNSLIVMNSFIHLLYRGKPNKCSTCGKRFGNTTNEKYLQGYHLDWHFRINKRIKGSSYNSENDNASSFVATQRNIQSRNWYIPHSEWIDFKDDEIVSTKFNNDSNEYNKAGSDNRRRNDNDSSNLGRKRRRSNENMRSPHKHDNESNNYHDHNGHGSNQQQELSDQYVVVPESMVDNSYKCPICQETVTSVYDDETGEWIWKNTIQVDGKYFHATCYYETKNK